MPKKDFKNLIKQIEELSVLELAELVKELEKKFGVIAAAPVTVGSALSAAEEKTKLSEEKTSFNVELIAAGNSKIQVIKIVKEIIGVGLKQAKDIVDAAPKIIKENLPKTEAEEIKKKLEEAGATVELK